MEPLVPRLATVTSLSSDLYILAPKLLQHLSEARYLSVWLQVIGYIKTGGQIRSGSFPWYLEKRQNAYQIIILYALRFNAMTRTIAI
jgi:hypothetical protein